MAPLTVKLWCLYYHHSLETWVSGIRHVDERGLRDAGGERLQGVGMAQAEQYFAADPQSKDVRRGCMLCCEAMRPMLRFPMACFRQSRGFGNVRAASSGSGAS
mgnify:CR=1 FL=1